MSLPTVQIPAKSVDRLCNDGRDLRAYLIKVRSPWSPYCLLVLNVQIPSKYIQIDNKQVGKLQTCYGIKPLGVNKDSVAQKFFRTSVAYNSIKKQSVDVRYPQFTSASFCLFEY